MMKITACILQKLYHYEKKVLTVMILLQIGTCAMVKHYNTSTGRTILCESVKCQGEINGLRRRPDKLALEFCKVNYSKDICKPCPKGSYMVDTIDSRLYENDRSIFKCVSSIHWSCPPEAEMVYGKTTDSNQPPCECDRSRGYYGPDYFNCYLVDKPCGLGLELSVKGNCVPCSPDTFKATNNFDLCISKTNCSEFDRYTISYGSTTSDVKCGPLMLSSTDKGHHNFINNDFEKSTIDVHSDSYQLQTNEGIFNMFSDRNIFLIIIIIPAVILVIVGPVAIGFCIKHRYSVHIKCCMEINRRKDRSSRIRREIPLQDKVCVMNFPIDLVFLNDESDNVSPEEWNTCLTVISDIVDAFTIGANDVRVGLAAYGDSARTIFDLDDYVTKNDIKAQIEGAVQNVSSSSDQRTALQHVCSSLFHQTSTGDRFGVLDVLVILSSRDGPYSSLVSAVENCRSRNPPMFIISAALKDTTTQLSETIATSEVSSVYYSNYADMVDALKLKITDNSLCNVAANSANCLGLNCGMGSCYINGEGFAKCTCPSCSFSDNCEHKDCSSETTMTADFENGETSIFTTDMTDNSFECTTQTGPTPSNNDTGPFAAYSGSRYVFLEASDYHNYAPGEYCLITSKTCRKLPTTVSCLIFYYHMNGADIGKLGVYVHERDASLGTAALEITGDQGNQWNQGKVQLDFSTFYDPVLSVKLEKGSGPLGDIGVDDFVLTQGTCPA